MQNNGLFDEDEKNCEQIISEINNGNFSSESSETSTSLSLPETDEKEEDDDVQQFVFCIFKVFKTHP